MKTKKVWYYGRVLEIPKDHYIVASDKSGNIISYGADIYPFKLLGVWLFSDARKVRYGDATLVGNYLNVSRNKWKETKVIYPDDYNFEEDLKKGRT